MLAVLTIRPEDFRSSGRKCLMIKTCPNKFTLRQSLKFSTVWDSQRPVCRDTPALLITAQSPIKSSRNKHVYLHPGSYDYKTYYFNERTFLIEDSSGLIMIKKILRIDPFLNTNQQHESIQVHTYMHIQDKLIEHSRTTIIHCYLSNVVILQYSRNMFHISWKLFLGKIFEFFHRTLKIISKSPKVIVTKDKSRLIIVSHMVNFKFSWWVSLQHLRYEKIESITFYEMQRH